MLCQGLERLEDGRALEAESRLLGPTCFFFFFKGVLTCFGMFVYFMVLGHTKGPFRYYYILGGFLSKV